MNPTHRLYACDEKGIVKMDSPVNEQAMQQDKANKKKMTSLIVLDPGHGGYDSGSVAGRYIEKTMTMQLANQVKKKLEKHAVEVILTRTNDDWYWTFDNVEDLSYRVSLAEEHDADLFLSLHLNSSSKHASGFEVWTSFHSAASTAFAETIQIHLTNINYTQARELKDQDTSPLYVLNNNRIPSVLAELGFITSDNDMAYISKSKGQEALSDALINAILHSIE